MLKVQHTEWPVGRKPMVTNQVKSGGLWFREEQEKVLNQAKRLAKKKPKDEVAEAMFWIRIIFGVGLLLIITFYLLNNHK